MPTYLMLTTLTEKGVQTLHANPDRLREVNRDVEEMGAKVLHQWAALGAYDFVNIVEAPDDMTIARVSVALGARGTAANGDGSGENGVGTSAGPWTTLAGFRLGEEG